MPDSMAEEETLLATVALPSPPPPLGVGETLGKNLGSGRPAGGGGGGGDGTQSSGSVASDKMGRRLLPQLGRLKMAGGFLGGARCSCRSCPSFVK